MKFFEKIDTTRYIFLLLYWTSLYLLLKDNGQLGWRITNLCMSDETNSLICYCWRAQFLKVFFKKGVLLVHCFFFFYNLNLLLIESFLEKVSLR